MKQKFNPLLIPENITAIIFDCDGTLVETASTHNAAWIKILKRYNVEIDIEYLDTFASVPSTIVAKDIFAKYNIDDDPIKIAQEKEDLYFSTLVSVVPINRTIEYVKHFYGKIPLIVISGGIRKGVVKSLEFVDILHYFDSVICADDGYPPKTDLSVFKIVAEELATETKNVVVFEDGEVGIVSALAAGMKVVDVREETLRLRG